MLKAVEYKSSDCGRKCHSTATKSMVSRKGAEYDLRQHTHDLHARNPASSLGDFNNHEIVRQPFNLIGHCGQ